MMEVKLTRYTKAPLEAIEEAACNCYDSDPMGGKIAKGCIRSGHLSVTEFADFTFHISGVSRALLAQLTRHRVASFAVRSQRYCSEGDFDFVVPDSVLKNEDTKAIYESLMGHINSMYKTLQSYGIPNEDARMVLPNACNTVIEVKMNFRELMHFFNERLCTRAQWEIRELAKAMRDEVLKVAPELKNFCVPKCEMYGKYKFCTEHKSCGRSPKLSDIYSIYDQYKDGKTP